LDEVGDFWRTKMTFWTTYLTWRNDGGFDYRNCTVVHANILHQTFLLHIRFAMTSIYFDSILPS